MNTLLHEGEAVIKIERRHWFWVALMLVKNSLCALLILVIPFFVSFWYADFFSHFHWFILFLVVIGLELIWLITFFRLADYYLDYWIITDRRIILIEERGMFNRTIQSVDFGSIQDVSTRVVGIFSTMLDFGDVSIQSAGTHGEFVFQQVPKPGEARNQILEAREKWNIKTANPTLVAPPWP